MEKINNLKKKIVEATSIGVASHIDPDGDNLGSICALKKSLEIFGKEVFLYIDDQIPRSYQFLPGVDESSEIETNRRHDLFFALDCADQERLGKRVGDLFDRAKTKVVIDHHLTNQGYGDLNFIEIVSSTGELLYEILKQADLPIDREVATCLYTAISSDTGSFKYDSTSSRTHEIAADLLSHQIDLNEITINLYQRRSLAKTNLLMRAMQNLKILEDGKIALTRISLDDLDKVQAEHSDTDGIVEFIRDIDGVELAIFLKDSKRSGSKISMRSKGDIDASKIAVKFGGGGHKRAAGASFNGDLDQCQEAILKVVNDEINAGNSFN